MKVMLRIIVTKVAIIIACLCVLPESGFGQDKGHADTKSQKGGKRINNNKRGGYHSRKKLSKRHWKNQDKATRKRMKRAKHNAIRRQKGKPMKNNRLV